VATWWWRHRGPPHGGWHGGWHPTHAKPTRGPRGRGATHGRGAREPHPTPWGPHAPGPQRLALLLLWWRRQHWRPQRLLLLLLLATGRRPWGWRQQWRWRLLLLLLLLDGGWAGLGPV
jgi:hypothetical protein